MLLGSWQNHFGSPSYDRLNEEENGEETTGKSIDCLSCTPRWLLYCLFTLSAITIILAGLVGNLSYRLYLSDHFEPSQAEGIVAQGTTLSTF